MIKHHALIAWFLVAAGAIQAAEPATTLTPLREIASFYNEHCIRCHKEGKANGGFRFDELLAKPTIEGINDPWMNVLEKLVSREMPPTDEAKRPSPADYEKQIAWLRGELETNERLTAAARERSVD
jgi:mono/diheme cytochrome c family protein